VGGNRILSNRKAAYKLGYTWIDRAKLINKTCFLSGSVMSLIG
jgi:hypothetical protein